MAFAQNPAPTPNAPAQVIGEVTALDAASRQITLKTDKGESLALTVRANAPVLRVAPGAKDIKSAARITLGEVAVGDRVAATIHKSAAGAEAGSVVVMAKSDIVQERQREQQDWQRRGTGGIVTALDPAGHTVTVRAGQRAIAIHPTAGAEYRRYAPDSVKYSDAKPSSFEEIKEGDQIRALGDRSPDGSSFTADRIVFGSFRQLAGTVASVHPETGEVDIKDLATKKPVTVHINSDTTMKKLPPETGAMLARRLQSAGRGGLPLGIRGGMPQPPGPSGAVSGRGGMASGMGDSNQLLDRLPPIPLGDLKPGDAIMVSSSAGPDPSHITAIMLLAGVEPLLTASPTATRDLMSGWLSGGGGEDLGTAQ